MLCVLVVAYLYTHMYVHPFMYHAQIYYSKSQVLCIKLFVIWCLMFVQPGEIDNDFHLYVHMQRVSSGSVEANRTTLATSILQSSEGIAIAIASTLKNMDTFTISRTNLGTCPYETLSCNKSSVV